MCIHFHLKQTRLILSVILLLLLAATAQQTAHASTQATITVNTTTVENVINGNCDLVEAVLAANSDSAVDSCPAGSGTDTIQLPAGIIEIGAAFGVGCYTHEGTATDCALPAIDAPLIIQGAGITDTVISRNPTGGEYRLFAVAGSTRLTLQSLAIVNGSSSASGNNSVGGGVVVGSGSELIVSSVRFQGNEAAWGGAIFSADSATTISIENSEFLTNQGGLGAALANGTITIDNTLFDNNGTRTAGPNANFNGTIILTGGDVTIRNSVVQNNGHLAAFGGISTNGSITLLDSRFENNAGSMAVAYLDGNSADTLHIERSVFHGNQARRTAIINSVGVVVTIEDAEFTENVVTEYAANGRGGALAIVSAPPATITRSLFRENESPGTGGAVALHGAALSVEQTAFIGNRSLLGSAISLAGNATLTAKRTTFAENSASLSQSGAAAGTIAVLSDGGNVALEQVTMVDNFGQASGGLVIASTAAGTEFTVKNSVIANQSYASGEPDLLNQKIGETLDSQGYNILGTNSADFISHATDLLNTEPQLATASQIGSRPQDWVALPLPGSPAIDAIPEDTNNPNRLANGCGSANWGDQRGYATVVNFSANATIDNRCDIGSAELQLIESHPATIAASETIQIDNLLVTITDTSTTTPLGAVTISRFAFPMGGTLDPGEMRFVTSVVPQGDGRTVANALSYDIRVCYTDWELANGNGVNPAAVGLVFDNFTTTQWVGGQATGNNCVYKSAMTQFGAFTVSSANPTAIALNAASATATTTTILSILLFIGLAISTATVNRRR